VSNERRLTVSEAVAAGVLRSPAPGQYRIEYSDNTHCLKDEWTPLLAVVPELALNPLVGSEDAQAFYTLRIIQPDISLAAEKMLGKQDKKQPEKKASDGDARRHVILDALTQSLVRANILRPDMTSDTLIDIYHLSRGRAAVIVPDTNALSTGTLHWLLEALSDTQVWLLPVVVSLVQVQLRDAQLKACVNKRESKYLTRALRSRQLINASLSLLERHRERYQVLEVDPQLLRYVRPAGAGSADPDEGDVLEDRLLMEAIHGALRATRTRAEKRVVTSDILLARMLRAEGLPTLFLQTPSLPKGDIPCLRYEPLAKAFVGAPLIHLLWELAHTFSSIRLVSDGQLVITLDAYWAAKTVSDWAEERMLVSWTDRAVAAMVPTASQETLEEAAEIDLAGAPPSAVTNVEPQNLGPSKQRRQRSELRAYSNAPLPEVAFPQIVRVAVALGNEGGAIEQLLGRIAEENRPSIAIARSAVEVLLRASLVSVDQGTLHPTERLGQFIDALSDINVDAASEIFSAYSPYRIVLERLLKGEGITTSDAYAVLSERLAKKPSREGSERLWRTAVYLGQAWSDDLKLRDGSSRPSQAVIRKAFLETFSELEQDGLCSLRDLLPALCGKLRISPWYLQQVVQSLVSEDRLSEVLFQPSAGKRLNARDQVMAIHAGDIRLISSPIDRLDIGGRPVFTLLRGNAS